MTPCLRPEVAAAREADRKAEIETLERFQQAQRKQLAQRQQLEQSVFQEQAKAVADLQALLKILVAEDSARALVPAERLDLLFACRTPQEPPPVAGNLQQR